ncbi:MAG: site-specific integrase [Colwellia sp.]|jgi:Site-specific recombinase XerD
MATITARNNNQFQAKIRKKGYISVSKTFPTKKAAIEWAQDIENKMTQGTFKSTKRAETTLISDAFERYWDEKVSKTKSASSTRYVINKLQSVIGHVHFIDISKDLVRDYKEYRLETVSGETVRKELLLLRRMIRFADSEWDIYLPQGNVAQEISLPSKSKERDRRLEPNEEEALMTESKLYGGYIQDLIILAIETAMRRSELLKLQWQYINLDKQTAYLLDTKNGDSRTVPLSTKAIEIISKQSKSSSFLFEIRADSIGQAFRRVCKRANICNLRFHDLRHEATTRFFELDLPIMEVAAITGHKDLRMLKRYTHLRAENLAKKLP